MQNGGFSVMKVTRWIGRTSLFLPSCSLAVTIKTVERLDGMQKQSNRLPLWIENAGFGRFHNFSQRSRSELPTTDSELKLIAALASIGLTKPKAASGTQKL